MLIGYARVSTRDQNLDAQIDQLKAAGAEKVFQEKVSGSELRNRLELKELLGFIREGDTLLVTKLDRLGRSVHDLIKIVHQLGEAKAHLKVMRPDMDTATAQGRMIFNIFAALAEFERELIAERTYEGIEAAKARGVVFGRPTWDVDELKKMAVRYMDLGGDAAKTRTMKAICDEFNISKATFYRNVAPLVKELQDERLKEALLGSQLKS